MFSLIDFCKQQSCRSSSAFTLVSVSVQIKHCRRQVVTFFVRAHLFLENVNNNQSSKSLLVILTASTPGFPGSFFIRKQEAFFLEQNPTCLTGLTCCVYKTSRNKLARKLKHKIIDFVIPHHCP
ncbi:hypothetical protein ATANTOWER_012287 [Ataeniobius toweri]|uniref:Uncharacterized protein n=1 Tax=Ataeniobius toweri TaxID=208326 RepID=A0ABU7BYY6_9TELE|nr:hypothetical protein [Ataeniobius toweri]